MNEHDYFRALFKAVWGKTKRKTRCCSPFELKKHSIMTAANAAATFQTNSNPVRREIMSKNNRITSTQPPVYILQPPQQPQNDSIVDGIGTIVLSTLAGLILGQYGIGLPKLPKL
jgi:hypothetical protein